jgi:hypothetical protein
LFVVTEKLGDWCPGILPNQEVFFRISLRKNELANCALHVAGTTDKKLQPAPGAKWLPSAARSDVVGDKSTLHTFYPLWSIRLDSKPAQTR